MDDALTNCSLYNNDIDQQASGNYSDDEIGNLVADAGTGAISEMWYIRDV